MFYLKTVHKIPFREREKKKERVSTLEKVLNCSKLQKIMRHSFISVPWLFWDL